jgi:hypothetical protein
MVPEPVRESFDAGTNEDEGEEAYRYLTAGRGQSGLVAEENDDGDGRDQKGDFVLDFAPMSFDEASLFAMSFGLFVVYVISPEMRDGVQILLSRLFGGGLLTKVLSTVFVALPFVAGMACSVYNAFSDKVKCFEEEAVMLFFGVVMSAGTGLMVGWHMMVVLRDWWLGPLAVWNFVYGVVLFSRFEGAVLTKGLTVAT